jgi:hypothetical protein
MLSFSAAAGSKRINKKAEQTEFKEDITRFVKIMNASYALSLLCTMLLRKGGALERKLR